MRNQSNIWNIGKCNNWRCKFLSALVFNLSLFLTINASQTLAITCSNGSELNQTANSGTACIEFYSDVLLAISRCLLGEMLTFMTQHLKIQLIIPTNMSLLFPRGMVFQHSFSNKMALMVCVTVWVIWYISEWVYTYYVSWCTYTSSSDAVAVRSVSTGTQLLAALSIIARWTGLIAVKPRPACCTGTLSWQGVTAETAKRL